jgi:hypothetical protein
MYMYSHLSKTNSCLNPLYMYLYRFSSTDQITFPNYELDLIFDVTGVTTECKPAYIEAIFDELEPVVQGGCGTDTHVYYFNVTVTQVDITTDGDQVIPGVHLGYFARIVVKNRANRGIFEPVRT